MSESKNEIQAVLRRVEETLLTARHGLEDLTGPNRNRRMSGLRNLIVFGRSVTWVLQNLKTPVGPAFETWYSERQKEMQADPLMRYFVVARNNLEKQGRLSVSTRAHIHAFSTDDISNFGPPPPGAIGFFVGDQLGGSGWEVELPDGSRQKYYVELPDKIAEVTQHFVDLPEALDPDLKGKPIEKLCELYLSRLDTLLDQARAEFLNEDARQRRGGRVLPSYLRVVK